MTEDGKLLLLDNMIQRADVQFLYGHIPDADMNGLGIVQNRPKGNLKGGDEYERGTCRI